MELLNKIQRELKVPKSQFNGFSKYHYRNAEDILEAVKPLLGKGTLTLSDEIVQLGDRFYVKATATLKSVETPDALANGVSVTAYAREAADKKGMDEAQITGAASSYARKYALNGLFCIDDTKDADNEDNSKATVTPTSIKTITGKLATPKSVINEQKKAIADLLKATAKADPNNLFDELEGPEEYAEACLQYTGMALEEDNFTAIIKKLTK